MSKMKNKMIDLMNGELFKDDMKLQDLLNYKEQEEELNNKNPLLWNTVFDDVEEFDYEVVE